MYQITLTKSQLELLKEITDKYARLLIGQVDKLDDVFTDALLKHGNNGERDYEYQRDCDYINNQLEILHTFCWKQQPNQYYGVKYSEKSDTLFDMHDVIRHQLWKDRGGDKSAFTNDSYPAHHWNTNEPLIKIENK